jgi:hypothetical protein
MTIKEKKAKEIVDFINFLLEEDKNTKSDNNTIGVINIHKNLHIPYSKLYIAGFDKQTVRNILKYLSDAKGLPDVLNSNRDWFKQKVEGDEFMRELMDEHREEYLIFDIKSHKEKLENFRNELLTKYNLAHKTNQQKIDSIKPFENLPANIYWDDVELRFTNDSFQEVEIYIKGDHFEKADFERFGCYKGRKNRAPDMQWNFLKHLSIIQEMSGDKNVIIKATQDAISEPLSKDQNKKISINSVEKYKSELEKRLKKLFPISGEPFHHYKKYKCYKTQFMLKPTPPLRNTNKEPFIVNRPKFNEEKISNNEPEDEES